MLNGATRTVKRARIGSTAHSYKTYLLVWATVFVLAIPVFALYMTDMPKNLQTKVQEPRQRALYLKLPLQQPRFHWTFMSRKDFLSGKLLLRIIRNGKLSEIVIFENGEFCEGWEAMALPRTPDRGEIYFGFISTRRYLTAPEDKLELELTVAKDLAGIGALQTGILPAGKYRSRGTYSGLIDQYETTFLAEELADERKMPAAEQEALLNKIHQMYEYKAFLESWTDQWPLKITGEKGWLTAERASDAKRMRKKLNAEVKHPSGSMTPAETGKKLFQKYIWFWIATTVSVLLIIIVLRQVFAKR